jgi:hypothetical protein
MKKIIIIVTVVIIATICISYPFISMFISIEKSVSQMQETEQKMRSSVYFQEAARQLAIYCQSVNTEIDDQNIGHFLYPKIIQELHPFYGHISPKGARVTIGGGFYPLGYFLELNQELSDEKTNAWDLYIYTESGTNPLYSLKLDKTEKIPFDKFVQIAVDEYDRCLGEKPDSMDLHTAKIHHLLLFGKQDLAYSACENAIKQNPKYWWPRLTLALIESASDKNNAYNTFSSWTDNNPDFTHYFYLAYFCYLEQRMPEFEAAIKKALELPLTTDEYDSFNVYYFGWNMAVMAYHTKNTELIISICDAMEDPKRESERATSGDHCIDFAKFKSSLESGDTVTINKWIGDRDIFDPYQSDNTNAIQPITIGKHIFPIMSKE